MTYPILVKPSIFLETRLKEQTQCSKTFLVDMFLYLLDIFVTAAPKWGQKLKKLTFSFNYSINC